ncbi:copper chaperone PCu(A)C [Pseudohoeflea suaedae]|uniref:Copper chaperone PCu(A)C n=1 Tax=Pseudohoeflea suaedae TaxID=877384 RepID=A0A4R5PNV9_9HYPH|nr:copper chaperone PCu(A)C [Pseudohoeflea suaedae]TDH38754.1 copper chaperone PCu(A)C [Pseudohoeflea suaedae]
MNKLLAAVLAFSAMAGIAQAHDFTVGDLAIHHPWAKATLPNQPVGGGFMEITNNGSKADRLVSGKADFAGEVQIHEMSMNDGVMKMRQLADGIEIAPGETVKLEPGGLHIMFMKLTEPLEEGEMKAATLSFEHAGDVAVEFAVQSPKPADGAMDHSKMDHSKMEGDAHADHSK